MDRPASSPGRTSRRPVPHRGWWSGQSSDPSRFVLGSQLLPGEHVLPGLVHRLHGDEPAVPVPSHREGTRPGAVVAHLLVVGKRKAGDLQACGTLVAPETGNLLIREVTQAEDLLRDVRALIRGVLHALEPE